MQDTFQRSAGILLPVSSLPSPYGIGTLGKEAYAFVDMLAAAEQRYWQVLPVGPTSYGDSPYQSYSAFAGNPYFIDLDMLAAEGLVSKEEIASYQWSDTDSYVSYDRIYQCRYPLLYLAYTRSGHRDSPEYREFVKKHGRIWLEDFALYCACKKYFEQKPWTEWDVGAKFRDEDTLEELQGRLRDEIDFQMFMQFKFREQWESLKQYANEKGIEIIGDIPLYMALDSADVWAHPELFKLDADLEPTYVAGCPPDAFSASGQLWGNPIYDWKRHEEDGFAWWRARMQANASLYDVIRIDHFIGIVRYYNIPAADETALNGMFEWGPAKRLTDAIDAAIGEKKVIAEDLGLMIPEVRELLSETGYPGMKVLQFAFDGDENNDHLPFRYGHNCIVYSGTHDNETLAGFCADQPQKVVRRLYSYFDAAGCGDVRQKVIRGMYASTADVAVLTVQDILGLGNEARMNTPSTLGDNWKWRLAPGQLTAELLEELQLPELVKIYGRKRR